MTHALRVCTFNICHTACLANLPSLEPGESQGLVLVAAIIAFSECDVCVIQEADGNQCPTCQLHGVTQTDKQEVMVELLHLLATRFGWEKGHVSKHTCVLSKWPIVEERGFHATANDTHAGAPSIQTRSHGWVTVCVNNEDKPPDNLSDNSPDQDCLMIQVCNVHLDWAMQPQVILEQNQGIKNCAMVQQEWIVRGGEMCDILRELKPAWTVPDFTILAGDFNTMSHLDEPECKEEMSWPITRLLQRSGFEDTFRVAHPDHSKVKGHTWYVPLPGYDMSQEVHSRLDYLFLKPHTSKMQCRVARARVMSGDPWPSDHMALMADLVFESVK